MGGKGGGQGDQSGVMAAMASEHAAELSYNLGEQQLQWAKDVWNQEQPLITQSENMQIQVAQQDLKSMQQMYDEAQQQWALYQHTYQPLEQQYVAQVEDWASPQNVALTQGEAQANVAEQTQAGINTAKEQLQSYGVKPDDPKFAGLYIGANTLGGAAQAAAGTTAAQNLKLQQLGLEQSAINTGRGVAGASGGLTNVATGAGSGGASASSGAAGTSQSNIATGTQAQTAPVNWFNTGATNMGVYTNAVNALNQTNLGYAQLGAQEAMGAGSLVGDVLGIMFPFGMKAEKGGPTGIPPMPNSGTSGGYVHETMSPSRGANTDDVPALLNKGEFVIDRGAAEWMGQKKLVDIVDKARQERKSFEGRDDIGGEPTKGIPMKPAFVSRNFHGGPPAFPHTLGIPNRPQPPSYG
jgi:hypothetical protein